MIAIDLQQQIHLQAKSCLPEICSVIPVHLAPDCEPLKLNYGRKRHHDLLGFVKFVSMHIRNAPHFINYCSYTFYYGNWLEVLNELPWKNPFGVVKGVDWIKHMILDGNVSKKLLWKVP